MSAFTLPGLAKPVEKASTGMLCHHSRICPDLISSGLPIFLVAQTPFWPSSLVLDICSALMMGNLVGPCVSASSSALSLTSLPLQSVLHHPFPSLKHQWSPQTNSFGRNKSGPLRHPPPHPQYRGDKFLQIHHNIVISYHLKHVPLPVSPHSSLADN